MYADTGSIGQVPRLERGVEGRRLELAAGVLQERCSSSRLEELEAGYRARYCGQLRALLGVAR